MKSIVARILLLCMTFLFMPGCSNKTPGNKPVVAFSKQTDEFVKGRLWKDTDTSFIKNNCPGKIFPLSYRLLDTDTAKLKQVLLIQGNPNGLVAPDTIEIEIPLPDGSWEAFLINQVQVMAPELAAKYPWLKTYSGFSRVNRNDQIRIEVNPDGFRAMILSTRGTMLLDPYCKGDKLHMISYFKKLLPEGVKEEFERK